ncbi:bifunctional 3-(3-hydroxy-phenyl)propionate/3-hydroxycinnamic acid hydroxylase [Paenarthrobacter sp. A20]|uniref:bifunctional 3-(3-hydroxy-phenyl)propionate/3-hydroxycinnamic acid hydroxylase MhpA n=1 Tax=Paenarthrobacter sp. A20 TaxID=2817891 RepID=UPI0020A0D2B6|nr:bifunctional 3-(3-hydroxy-phenyl)propionate/3-hydroxycinnamic acid hydroxylase [Paenarthrobacter sp. A20]MCP1415581.1 3-(3-hydroxy-phenyl)propionate hydroxylase [Paenarthrobacter sp. A20]
MSHLTGNEAPTVATTSTADEDFDVIVVGYGPVGRLLALKLGRRGHRVAVVERQEQVYPLPRAVHFDDEIGRIFQSVGAGPDKMSEVVEPYDDFYEWRNATHETILRLDWRNAGPSGWNVSNFFYQPGMENFLNSKVMELDTVSLLRGWEAITHTETADRVNLQLRNTSSDERKVFSARYIIGADGANSKVRDWIGTAMTDLGYFHDWLVVDLLPTNPLQIDPPASQFCDPARPTTVVPGGPGRRRFEFMRLEHETKEELNTEARAWELLKDWGVTPDTATMERHTVYTFQARWCDQWRRGRLLLAGDSAHLMPPFAGQGMCSGLRDAANLEWKLDLVLRGLAPDSILDTYGSERSEHVRHFIERSMQLGEVICLTDEAEARARDAAMAKDIADGTSMPPRPLPRLGDGLHRDDAGGGTLAIQAPVRNGTQPSLFDDALGSAGTLLLRTAADRSRLSAESADDLANLGFKVISFASSQTESTAVDSTGAYAQWFDALDADAVLVRPDFYIYGVAKSDDLSTLVEEFLTTVGMATTPVPTRGLSTAAL